MGNSLYWKKTPKEEERTYNGINRSTWELLTKLWNKEEKEDVDGVELNKDNLKTLKVILLTAEESNNVDLEADMRNLIDAIETHGSITLYISG